GHRDVVRPPDDGRRGDRTAQGLPPEPSLVEGPLGRPPEGRPRDRPGVPPPLLLRPRAVPLRDYGRLRDPRVGRRRDPLLARPQRPLVRRPRDPRRDLVPLRDGQRGRVRLQLAGPEPPVDPLGIRSRTTDRITSYRASVRMPRGWKCVRAARWPQSRKPSRNEVSFGGDPLSRVASSSVVTKNGGRSASPCIVERSRADSGGVHSLGANRRTRAASWRGPIHSGP